MSDKDFPFCQWQTSERLMCSQVGITSKKTWIQRGPQVPRLPSRQGKKRTLRDSSCFVRLRRVDLVTVVEPQTLMK